MARADTESIYVDNWQTGKTVTECNLHMLTTEDCSDVTFRVGSEKEVVRAHRYVLVSRSCVFHAMFCGPLTEKGEVTIPDIDPDVFREFMRYIYTDTVAITSDNVTGLLYTSRKYAVEALLNQCATFLEKSLSEDNVCQILEQCHGYGELDLEQKALKILTEATVNVIKSAWFLNLCWACLCSFVKSERLRLREEQVFHAVMSWAAEKCKEENVIPSGQNIRKVLGDKIYEIRFLSFSSNLLVKVVGRSGVLTDGERVLIMDKKVDSSVDISPFKSDPRNNVENIQIEQHLMYKAVQRFRSISENEPGTWPLIGGQNAISFSSSKNIQLVGCQLYGPAWENEAIYSLNILMFNNKDQMVAEPVFATAVKLTGKKKVNDIMFRDAVSIIAGRIYTICVNLAGVVTNYGGNGLARVETDGVVFTFMTSGMTTALCKVEEGQIPGLLWC